jgi:signal transduction histidine kinase
MGILLLTGVDNFEVIGMYEKSDFRVPSDFPYIPKEDPLGLTLAKNKAQWFTKPWEQFKEEGDDFTDWLFQGQPDMLFILPIRIKGEIIGTFLFVMGSIEEADQAMLTTLGTIYALHVGMTYKLIRITKEREHMQNQLMMQEKMASLGNLIAGVAHEINTPMGAISSMHDTLVRAVHKLRATLESKYPDEYRNNGEVQSALRTISDANRVIGPGAERVAGIVRSLRRFARLDEAELKKADIHEGLEETLMLINHDLKDRIKVIRNFGEIQPIVCYPGRLNQVFLNLLINSNQAIGDKGEIVITTFQRDNKVNIVIEDSGIGIPEEHLKKVFDPGFTTKGVKVGTGLGLSICYQIVQDHEGEIRVESKEGKGTTFTVILPMDLDERIRTG